MHLEEQGRVFKGEGGEYLEEKDERTYKGEG